MYENLALVDDLVYRGSPKTFKEWLRAHWRSVDGNDHELEVFQAEIIENVIVPEYHELLERLHCDAYLFINQRINELPESAFPIRLEYLHLSRRCSRIINMYKPRLTSYKEYVVDWFIMGGEYEVRWCPLKKFLEGFCCYTDHLRWPVSDDIRTDFWGKPSSKETLAERKKALELLVQFHDDCYALLKQLLPYYPSAVSECMEKIVKEMNEKKK